MKWVAIGIWAVAVGVAAGAFGAHGLRSRVDAPALEQWQTAVRYWLVAATSVAVLGLAGVRGAGIGPPATVVLAGGVIFASAVGGLALGGPRWLGAIAPIGGSAIIFGLLWAGFKIWKAV